MTREPWRWFLSLWLVLLLHAPAHPAARWAALLLGSVILCGTLLGLTASMAQLRRHYRDHGLQRGDPGNV